MRSGVIRNYGLETFLRYLGERMRSEGEGMGRGRGAEGERKGSVGGAA